MPSAFTRSPLHLRSPSDEPVCRCLKHKPLSTVPSSWSPGPNLMAQEFRALTPSPDAMGRMVGVKTANDEMSPPASAHPLRQWVRMVGVKPILMK